MEKKAPVSMGKGQTSGQLRFDATAILASKKRLIGLLENPLHP